MIKDQEDKYFCEQFPIISAVRFVWSQHSQNNDVEDRNIVNGYELDEGIVDAESQQNSKNEFLNLLKQRPFQIFFCTM